jgi:RHS repeat-associated protein
MSSAQQRQLSLYRYDPLNRLIHQTQANTPELQRFYCKSRLATEIQGAISYSIVQHGDQLLGQQQSEAGASDTTLLAPDQQRSILHTLQANHQRKPISYSPYGHRPVASGLLSLLGFNGERPDPVTGHYLLGNGYRAFNPVLLRFNSPDSWSPFGKGGVNSYAYCLGDPINRSDPNGHGWISDVFNRLVNMWRYRNGPKITHYEDPHLGWKEVTHGLDETGRVRNLRIAKLEEGSVIVKEYGKPRTRYKHNASLKEMSYSKTSSAELEIIPEHNLPVVSIDIDVNNMHNEFEKHRCLITKSNPGMDDRKRNRRAKKATMEAARAGEVRGVDRRNLHDRKYFGQNRFDDYLDLDL